MEARKLSKLHDTQRRWESFLHQTRLLGTSFASSYIVVFLWNTVFRSNDIHLPHEDEAVLIAIGIAVPVMLFSILAAMLITESYKRYKKIAEYILTQNKKSFMVIRDEKFPIIIHVLQFFLSLVIIEVTLLLTYTSFWSGVVVVGSTTFVISLYWIAILGLQNPLRSPWFKERIPEHWLTADVDELLDISSEK